MPRVDRLLNHSNEGKPMSDLDQKVRDYYHSQSFDESKLDKLLSEQKPRARLGLGAQSLAVAASIVLGLFVGYFGMDLFTYSPAETIAREVAKNHGKGYAPEIETSEIRQIQAQLDRLDFRLTTPAFIGFNQIKITGGRYCSIQGSLAAQLTMESTDGNPCSLYITAINADLSVVEAGVYEYGDYTVEIWRDRDLFFALAE